jgi:hypothetical protein
MKNTVFWDIKHSSYLTGDTSRLATEPSRLKLWKILGFHGGDYEECRLLGYKTQFVPHRRHITSRYRAKPVKAMEDLRFSRR